MFVPLFPVIFFVTGATFTDPLTCSFLILSFIVTPYIHLSVLISFTSSLFSGLFVVDHVFAPYNDAGLTSILYICSPFTFLDHLLVQGRPGFQSSSAFDLVPCLQSVGIYSCLPVCCPSISCSVDLCSFSQKLLVATISHTLCGWVLASSSGQTTLVLCFLGKFQQVLCVPLYLMSSFLM